MPFGNYIYIRGTNFLKSYGIVGKFDCQYKYVGVFYEGNLVLVIVDVGF